MGEPIARAVEDRLPGDRCAFACKTCPMTGNGMAEVRGRAENGEYVAVSFPSHAVGEVKTRWPPLGLELSYLPLETPASLELAVKLDELSEWDRLESDLTIFAANRLERLVAIHAAVIAGEGHVLLVPGSSHSGKSRLCVAALDAGMQVLTDELALVDPETGLVEGWKRPVRFRQQDGSIRRVPLPEGVGPSAGRPVAVTFVASIKYLDIPDGPDLETDTLTPGEIAMILMANAVCAQRRPNETFSAAVSIARVAQGVRGFRGEAEQALEALLWTAKS